MIGAWKALTGAGRAIVAGLATIALLCVLMAVLTMCGGKAAIRKGEAGQTLAEGRTGAAQDASAVRDRADARDDTISNAVTEGTDDVRQALIALLLISPLAGACARSIQVLAPTAGCSSLIPAGRTEPVPSGALPPAEAVESTGRCSALSRPASSPAPTVARRMW